MNDRNSQWNLENAYFAGMSILAKCYANTELNMAKYNPIKM